MSWNSDTLFEVQYCPCAQDLKAFISSGLNAAWRELGLPHQWYLPSRPRYSASPPRVTPKSSGTTQSQLQTQDLQPGGTQKARMPTPHSSVQSATQTPSCWEGKHFTLHYIRGNTLSTQQQALRNCMWFNGTAYREIQDLCASQFPLHFTGVCTPNSLDPFEKANLTSFGPYIHPCKHTEGNRSIHRRNKHLYSFSLRT